jgi:hypothetical protein
LEEAFCDVSEVGKWILVRVAWFVNVLSFFVGVDLSLKG